MFSHLRPNVMGVAFTCKWGTETWRGTQFLLSIIDLLILSTKLKTKLWYSVFLFYLLFCLQGVKIRIVQTPPTDAFPQIDTNILSKEGLADVRSLNITRLVGSGILHTKMWLVDGKHFYVGSANQDWRALTQVQLSEYF